MKIFLGEGGKNIPGPKCAKNLYIHTHTYTCTCVHIHTHTHTHTHSCTHTTALDKEGKPALFHCMHETSRHAKCLSFLLECGADPNTKVIMHALRNWPFLIKVWASTCNLTSSKCVGVLTGKSCRPNVAFKCHVKKILY